jgi:transposase
MKNEIRPNYDEVLMFPPSLEDWVGEDHPARFIRVFVDSIDLESLGFSARKAEVGAPSYTTSLLLKVWLYGYLTKIYSTRNLERACMDMLPMIWLTGNNAPDHNTLWRFSMKNRHLFKEVFRKSVEVAAKSGLLGIALHAVDGTKIKTKSSKNAAVHREDLEKLLEEVDESVDEMFREVDEREIFESGEVRLPKELRDSEALKDHIRKILQEMDDRGTNHLNLNDPDSRMMQVENRSEFAYNAQVAVDSESGMIVGEDVLTVGNDNHALDGMLDEVEDTVGQAADETVADAGYYSSEELARAEEKGRSVLVNMKRMSGGEGEGEFHSSKFIYYEERDCVVCPYGNELYYSNKQKRKNGLEVRIFRCRKTNCEHKDRCTNSKKGRTVKIGLYHSSMVRQRKRQRDPTNKFNLNRRMAIVEKVFGTIKETMGIRRWCWTGHENARNTWSLICAVFNLKKLYKLWMNGIPVLQN